MANLAVYSRTCKFLRAILPFFGLNSKRLLSLTELGLAFGLGLELGQS